MEMVVHQAICPNLQAVSFRIYCQQFKVGLAVFVIKKHNSAVITTLCDVMRISGCYDTCNYWYEVSVLQSEGGN